MPIYPLTPAAPSRPAADAGRPFGGNRAMPGFTPPPFPRNPPPRFAVRPAGPVEIMVKRTPGGRPALPANIWDVYLRVGNGRVRQAFADLSAKGVVVRPLQRMPYGDAEFDVRDPDGYVICLSERLADASDLPG